MATLKMSNLDNFRGSFLKITSDQKEKKYITNDNLIQDTKTLHLSHGRGFLVTYSIRLDMATLKMSNLDHFREVFPK